jgi:hypothetical protein
LLGFLIGSYVFGLHVWLEGLLVTYKFWGWTGVFFGLFFGGIGVVPLGIVAASLNGAWLLVSDLLFGIVPTFGVRAPAFYFARNIDRQSQEIATPEVAA